MIEDISKVILLQYIRILSFECYQDILCRCFSGHGQDREPSPVLSQDMVRTENRPLSCKCTKCGKKPRWSKNSVFHPFLALLIPSYVTSGIIAFSMLPTVAPWLFLLANIGVVAWAIVRKAAYPKRMAQLPKAYTPVIGSFNPSLVRVAAEVGRTMPTPDECIAAVRGYNQKAEVVQPFIAPIENHGFAPANFCRKCGTKFKANRIFCHKCRTEIMKE